MSYRDDRDAILARNQALSDQLEDAEERADKAEQALAIERERAEHAERERARLAARLKKDRRERAAPLTRPHQMRVAGAAAAAILVGAGAAVFMGVRDPSPAVPAKSVSSATTRPATSPTPAPEQPPLEDRELAKLLALGADVDTVVPVLRLLEAGHQLEIEDRAGLISRFQRPTWVSQRDLDRAVAGIAEAASSEPAMPGLDGAARQFHQELKAFLPELERALRYYRHERDRDDGGALGAELRPAVEAGFARLRTSAAALRQELRRLQEQRSARDGGDGDLRPILDAAWLACSAIEASLLESDDDTLEKAMRACQRAQSELASAVRHQGPDQLEYLSSLYDKLVVQARRALREDEPQRRVSIYGHVAQLHAYAARQHARHRTR